MIFRTLRTHELDNQIVSQIATIKDSCWSYGIASQIDWLRSNCCPDDMHVLMCEEGRLVGYCSITDVAVTFSSRKMFLKGLGGVCVESHEQGRGLGSLLVRHATEVITGSSRGGILLCRENLVPFYGACGWDNLMYECAHVGGSTYSTSIMTVGLSVQRVKTIDMDRNF